MIDQLVEALSDVWDRLGLPHRDHAYAAEVFVNSGAHYVVPDFINVLEAGGSLLPMAEQVRRAVAWVYRNAQTFGGDPSRLYVSGFSSGAHLAGVVLITDWVRDFNLPDVQRRYESILTGVMASRAT